MERAETHPAVPAVEQWFESPNSVLGCDFSCEGFGQAARQVFRGKKF